MAVTPQPGLASAVATGGAAVVAAGPTLNGIIITNPASATDQGVEPAETLYVNPVAAAGLAANGTTFAIPPGGSWTFNSGQTTNTSVNAPTSGHKFSVIVF
jgi:hypothetical protein